MAESFSGNILVAVTGQLTGDLDIGTGTHAVDKNYRTTFTNGTGANQANMMWTDTRTISGSGSDDIDLAGVLTSAFGTTITFTSIKGIVIQASSSNGDSISVGGDATAALANLFAAVNDEIVVAPGGTFAIVNPNADGYAVTASTADILEITNLDAAAVTYDIIIIGEV